MRERDDDDVPLMAMVYADAWWNSIGTPARVQIWRAEMDARCAVCATTQHTSEAHLRRMPYDEARAALQNMTPCAAHFACINKLTCQKPGADRD